MKNESHSFLNQIDAPQQGPTDQSIDKHFYLF